MQSILFSAPCTSPTSPRLLGSSRNALASWSLTPHTGPRALRNPGPRQKADVTCFVESARSSAFTLLSRRPKDLSISDLYLSLRGRGCKRAPGGCAVLPERQLLWGRNHGNLYR